MTRSFPEKTLEHWCSMHLSYRYRAKALMWWPASGADMDVITTPQSWGKRLWLELKTTEWKPKPGRHELLIDLVQLRRYGHQSVPDYYVFPVPKWNGHLTTTQPWLAGLAPQRLAYQSHSEDKWFAEWTWVVPGRELRTALATVLAGVPMGATKKSHRIAVVTGGALSWNLPGFAAPSALTWRAFWKLIEQCGNANWGSQFLLPPNLLTSPIPTRSSLATALRGLAQANKTFDDQVVAYNWESDDSYFRQSDGSNRQNFDWSDGSRAIVTLNEHALAR